MHRAYSSIFTVSLALSIKTAVNRFLAVSSDVCVLDRADNRAPLMIAMRRPRPGTTRAIHELRRHGATSMTIGLRFVNWFLNRRRGRKHRCSERQDNAVLAMPSRVGWAPSHSLVLRSSLSLPHQPIRICRRHTSAGKLPESTFSLDRSNDSAGQKANNGRGCCRSKKGSHQR
jgi:hypothetical protein